MKFTKVGDKIEGTLIGRSQMESRITGEMQNIYEIKLKNDAPVIDGEEQKFFPGDIWMVGGKKVIDNQMRHVRLGQIVAFVFDREVPSKTAGISAMKFIQIYANQESVDKEWLKEMENEDLSTDIEPEIEPANELDAKASEQEKTFLDELDKADAQK